MCDVLASNPDRVAIYSRRTVITPAGARRVANLRFIAGKAIVRRGSLAARNNVPGTNAYKGINRREGRAWIEGIASSGECHYTTTAPGDTNCRVGEVIASSAKIALNDDSARTRIDDEPGNACTLSAAIRVNRRVERAPQIAIRVHHLLHACVVRIWSRDNLVVCRLGAE